MSTLSELQKKLQQESQGIMFPFSAATPAVNTTQQVYDSSTDGIMTMTGKKYIGPDAVIQYGTEEQGFPRQLKQIEAPMLPQVSNLPPQGTGIMELAPGTSTPEPISTDPVVEQPAVDPCPPGYQLVNGVCRPIEQPKDGRKEPIKVDPRKNIGDVAKGLGIATKALQKAEISSSTKGDISLDVDNGIFWLNFLPFGSTINALQKSKADKQLKTLNDAEGISVTTNPNGTLKLDISEKEGRTSYGQLQTKESLSGNMASTQKLNAAGTAVEKAPNGQNMIVGPLTLSYFGRTNLFAPENQITMPRDAAGNIIRNEATETAFRKKLQDRTQTVDALNAEEKNKLIGDLDSLLKGIATNKPEKFEEIKTDFGELSKNFGELQSSLLDTTNQLASIQENMLNMMKGRGTDTVELAKLKKQEKKLKVKKDNEMKKAETLFKQSVEATKDQPLTDNEKNYLDSSNRKALAGESKDKNGNVDNRSGKVSGRENSGFGFKATSANYNKKTNTFDQRFK
jgi:hypothetical protein